MTVKQLNLESIQDDIMDECFVNENNTFERISEQSHDSTEEVEESTDDVGSFKTYNTSSVLPEGETNESIIRLIRDGINVKRNIDLIVRNNVGLVYSQARQCTCNIPFQDKAQYAFEGLMRAIHRYDVNQNILFSTYATVSIRQTLYNFGNDEVRLISIPRHLSVDNIKIQNYIEKHRSKFGRTPSEDEISTATGIKLSAVKRVVQYMNSKPMSFDTPMGSDSTENDMSLVDVIPGTSNDYTLSADTVQKAPLDVIALVMSELPEEEQLLINKIHGLNGHEESTFITLETAGLGDAKGKNLTNRCTIHRRYNAILDKIRNILKARDISFDD